MRKIVRLAINKIHFLTSFVKALVLGFFYQNKYKTIKTVCLFIGYPRSGHSLIAALLDAHPDIIIGMEWGALLHVYFGYKKKQLFYSLIRNSYLFSKKKNNIWTGYSYKIHGGWQGKFRKLLVIGDKQGGRTSIIIKAP